MAHTEKMDNKLDFFRFSYVISKINQWAEFRIKETVKRLVGIFTDWNKIILFHKIYQEIEIILRLL